MEISEQIIEVLDYLSEKVGVSIDWTGENIMPYLNSLCEKYIRYETATSVMWIFIGIIVIVSTFIISKKAYGHSLTKKYYSDKEPFYVIIAVCLIFQLSFTAVVICQIRDIITCCTIPEKVILDYIKSAIPKN